MWRGRSEERKELPKDMTLLLYRARSPTASAEIPITPYHSPLLSMVGVSTPSSSWSAHHPQQASHLEGDAAAADRARSPC